MHVSQGIADISAGIANWLFLWLARPTPHPGGVLLLLAVALYTLQQTMHRVLYALDLPTLGFQPHLCREGGDGRE